MPDLAEGYYWVRSLKETPWEVGRKAALEDAGEPLFYLTGYEEEDRVAEIGPRIEPPTD